MKLKKIVIISIFLIAIFMISSVSATQNTTQSDEFVQSSNIESDIVENTNDNTSITKITNNSEVISTGTEKLNFDADVNSEYLIDSEESISIETPKIAAQKISVYIDNKLLETKIDTIDEPPILSLDFKKIGLSPGLHNITFIHPGDSRFAPLNKTYSFSLVYFKAYIPKTNWGDESGMIIRFSESAQGSVTIYADKKVFLKVTKEYLEDREQIRLDSLSYGIHEIEARYEGPEGTFSKFGKFSNEAFSLTIEDNGSVEWGITEIGLFTPSNYQKQPTLKIGGKTYKFIKELHYYSYVKINKNDLKIGKNTIIFYYPGDKKYSKMTKTITFEVKPQIVTSEYLGLNQKESIIVNVPNKNKATYTLYEVSGDDLYDLKYKKISSGKVNRIVYLPKLKLGDHSLLFVYKDSNNYVYKQEFTITVKKNTKGFKSSVKPKTIKFGHELTIKIKSPKLKNRAYIYLDNMQKKSVNLKKGKATVKLPIYSSGKHKITVLIESGKKFYLKTYYITVKKPTSYIQLKPVTVKKSAKKLILTATVKKPNGKPIKGKKITFKFNNKVFKSKTNKKGIAKVTVKKSILKKLKVGAKVKYEATYQYSIKKSAKIKK